MCSPTKDDFDGGKVTEAKQSEANHICEIDFVANDEQDCESNHLNSKRYIYNSITKW